MKLIRFLFFTIVEVCVAMLAIALLAQADSAPTCTKENENCIAARVDAASRTLKDLPTPKVTPSPNSRLVTYSVEARGIITANLTEFKTQAYQTLHDGRGWSRLGVNFQEVASGGDFTLVLAEASQVPSFSPGCDAAYSCNVGRFVIINQDRWLGATPAWNNAGGSLLDYRHMVINHEVGHWLGHGHRHCSGAGQPAPVMQQQSIDLEGCTFNHGRLRVN